MNEEIIDLEEGYSRVLKQGIQPFIGFIETQEREFFQAKNFVYLYDLIFKMCIQRDPYNWSEQMYERYTSAIHNYLTEKVEPSFQAARKQQGGGFDAAFLNEWKQRWTNQKLIVKGLSKLFMYLDRFYTPNTDGVNSLKEQGFKLYKDHVFDHFSSNARQAILNCVEKERNGEEQDRTLLQEAVKVFVEMGYNYAGKKLSVYKSALETDLVSAAGSFYKRKSRSWMDEDSCPTYLEKAEKMLNHEKNRVESYLNPSSLDVLTKECYLQLLKEHQAELLNKKTGVHQMLTINAVDDLSRMYRLYSKYPQDLEFIAELVLEHIKNAGTEVVDKANATGGAAVEGAPAADTNHQLVRNLIALHAQYNTVVSQCFEKAPVFQKALKKAFEDFINKDNRVSKLLAKYVNDVLKKGTKVNIKDVDATLDNVVFLYGYIQEKDVFERDYQLFLATRLLAGLCESEHSEKSMIAKLKTECGYQWTNKLEGMFKDVQLSKELMEKFKGFYDTSQEDLQLDVIVCTTGYWPSGKKVPCKMPQELSNACNQYKKFYLGAHGGRKLEMRMDSGQAELQVAFSKAVKRGLILSTYQMMILLVFNSQKVASLQQLMDITGIPQYEISNHLLSLCHPKVQVLLKRPNTKELEPDHKFMLNAKYTSQLMSVVVPLLKSVDQTPEQTLAQDKAIQLQRRHQMDAAIVRIMKTRKTLKHALLTAEVIQQLSARFKAQPNDIKKRIEALIEQEYLERDPNNRGTYNYLA
jgi:cullin 1